MSKIPVYKDFQNFFDTVNRYTDILIFFSTTRCLHPWNSVTKRKEWRRCCIDCLMDFSWVFAMYLYVGIIFTTSYRKCWCFWRGINSPRPSYRFTRNVGCIIGSIQQLRSWFYLLCESISICYNWWRFWAGRWLIGLEVGGELDLFSLTTLLEFLSRRYKIDPSRGLIKKLMSY